MADIIPAVLPKNFRDLEEKLALVAGHVPLVHIDVTDGTLTSGAHWPYAGSDGEWEKIQNEEAGLPAWEDLNFEAHLMVKDPASIYEEWIRAGVERLIIQFESFDTAEARSEFLLKLRKHFSASESFVGLEIGLAVGFDTPADAVLPHVLECDFIELMSIQEIGKQGGEFREEIFDKIEKIKFVHPDTIIAVDGGVNLENAEKLGDAGVERLVVGSAIFAAESPLDALEDVIIATE